MAIKKEKKVEIVKDMEGRLKGIKSAVFVGFDRLTVAKDTALRRRLRAEGVGYKVAKKTLVKRALDAQKYEGAMPDLIGEVAVAYGDDLLAPAREVYSFQKENKDNIQILGGVFEGKYMSKEEMLAIALIPPMQTLRGMFVNIINSPIQRFVIALDQIAKKQG